MAEKAHLIAAIDIGTNSFHMVTAYVNSRGMLDIKSRDKVMVRLGSGGGDMKYLEPEAIKRGINTLKAFSKIAQSDYARIRAVATSAVREAENRNIFLEKVKKETGISIEVISGLEEARLIYIGVVHALPVFDKKALIVDIGGGSTEAVIGEKGKIVFSNSSKLGAIRISSRFFPDGRITEKRVAGCREYIRGNWYPIIRRLRENEAGIFVGTSGTIVSLAVMVLVKKNEPVPEVLNGLKIKAKDMLGIIDDITKKKTTNEREKIPGMDAKRADIIVGGALIVEHAIKELNIKQLLISTYALREGIVFDTIQKTQAISEYKNLTSLRYETVYHLCKKYDIDMAHAGHVRRIAVRLYDDLQEIHNLGPHERELLEAASLLHDAGYYISHDKHHKHSYYLITNSMMPGFTNDEAELIANIARYHRKSHPKKKHENFINLSPSARKVVWILGGILRIAEGIDRRGIQIVSDISAIPDLKVIRVEIKTANKNDNADIELWGAIRRKTMLEQALKKKIRFELI